MGTTPIFVEILDTSLKKDVHTIKTPSPYLTSQHPITPSIDTVYLTDSCDVHYLTESL